MDKILNAYNEYKAFYFMNEEAIIDINYSAINDDFVNVIEKRLARKDAKQSVKFEKIK